MLLGQPSQAPSAGFPENPETHVQLLIEVEFCGEDENDGHCVQLIPSP
jgi:hypothetical protein